MVEETRKGLLARAAWLLRHIPLVGALVILLVVNGTLLTWQPLAKVDPESLPAARTWVWWAAQDYRHRDPVPDVVMLGSSVVMHPFWHQEATFRNKDVDLVADHRSTYLESMIKNSAPTGLSKLTCFNFALPGAMVSDTCMIARSMFTGDRKPKVAVFGFSPREFVDNRFNCAASSKHYQYLARFTDTKPLVDMSMPQLWQRPNYWVKDLIYFKGKSHDTQIVLDQVSRAVMAPVLAALPPSPLERVTDEDRRFAIYKEELEKGIWVAHPTSPYKYIDAIGDCRKRFRSTNDPLYKNQTQWLDLALTTCREKGILPVIINMPVTDVAKSQMAPGIYTRHVETLKAMAAKHDCPFVDVDVPNYYAFEDFTDWAHMDASGGEKVIALIGKFLASNERTVAAISTDRAIASEKRRAM